MGRRWGGREGVWEGRAGDMEMVAGRGGVQKGRERLTINVPLFKKLRDIIFFCGTITL